MNNHKIFVYPLPNGYRLILYRKTIIGWFPRARFEIDNFQDLEDKVNELQTKFFIKDEKVRYVA